MNPRPSGFQQAFTGLMVAVGIIATVICGIILVRIETGQQASFVPRVATATPTLFRISTLPGVPPTPTHRATISAPTVIVIPSSTPATQAAGTSPTASAPTATPNPAVTPTPGGPLTSCTISPSWTVYRIQPGDTLFMIGLRYGLTVDSIMRGNCLVDTSIRSGGTLYVPPVTPIPLSTWQALQTATGVSQADPPGTATATQTATDGACTNPDSLILSPKVGQVLTGKISITGTARVPNFAFYKLELRQEGTSNPYANVFTGSHEVTQGILTILDTATFPNGEYWLRLVVVDTDGNYPERCAMLVVFKN